MYRRVDAIILDLTSVADLVKQNVLMLLPDMNVRNVYPDFVCQWIIRQMFFTMFNIPVHQHDYRDDSLKEIYRQIVNLNPDIEKIFWTECSEVLRYWHPIHEARIFSQGKSVYLVDVNKK